MTMSPERRRQWTEAQMESEICRRAATQAGVAPDDVTSQSRLIEDLGFDSLDLVELVIELEDVFGIKLSDERIEAQPPKSVADVIRLIWELLQK